MANIERFAPGLAVLLHYKLADAPADIKAGLAVAAVAVPVGIAYAGLAANAMATNLCVVVLGTTMFLGVSHAGERADYIPACPDEFVKAWEAWDPTDPGKSRDSNR
jgi:MFS superfamily sulfate permease-like transporter